MCGNWRPARLGLAGAALWAGLGFACAPPRQVYREGVPRMPEPDSITIAGLALPHLLFAPFDVSAAAELRAAVRALVAR